MLLSIHTYSHAAAILAYLSFAALLLVWGGRSWFNAGLVIASTATAIWSGAALLDRSFLIPHPLYLISNSLRDGCWYLVLFALLYTEDRQFPLLRRLFLVSASVLLLDATFGLLQLNLRTGLGVTLNFGATRMACSVIGLVLVENLMRNVDRDMFWSVKMLGIGLAAVFAFQLLSSIPEFLVQFPDSQLGAAQPLVHVLILPLLVVSAIRIPRTGLRVHSSRRVVFHTAALIAAGIILQGTALVALYLRTYGGSAGAAVATVFVFAALVALAVALTSASMRSRIMSFINENFFSYKYDYRVEWRKFIRSLSAWDESATPLRVLRTLSELLDSPGGALWVWRESWQRYVPAAGWSFPEEIAALTLDDAGMQILRDTGTNYLELVPGAGDEALAWQKRFPFAWLVVPLRYRSQLVAVAVLLQPRSKRELNWEDSELIALVALQLAVYVAQDETAQALADARQLEEFNRRVAFITHDIKNTMGQLSLVASNAKRFWQNEDFRNDMVETVEHSVSQLQELLSRLKGKGNHSPQGSVVSPEGERKSDPVDVTQLVSDFVSRKRKVGLDVVLAGSAAPVVARVGDGEAFVGVLEHVVSNAVDAAPDSPVSVSIGERDGHVRIDVEDRGAGMTPEFIINELFRPLHSTKRKGLGLGAYQARETMRGLGGDLEVMSKVGEGTRVSLRLQVG